MKILILFIFAWIVLFALRTLYQEYIFQFLKALIQNFFKGAARMRLLVSELLQWLFMRLYKAAALAWQRISGLLQFLRGLIGNLLKTAARMRLLVSELLQWLFMRLYKAAALAWRRVSEFAWFIFVRLYRLTKHSVNLVLRFLFILLFTPSFVIKRTQQALTNMRHFLSRLPVALKTGLALLFSALALVGGFTVIMQWVEPRFPSLIRSTLFFFSTILALLIFRYFSFFTKTVPGITTLVFLLLFETMMFRPFIFSHVVFFPILLVCLTLGIMVWSFVSSGSILHKAIRMVVAFYGAVPFLILLSMLMGYHGTHKCAQAHQNLNIRFLLDFCSDKWKTELAAKTGYSMHVLSLNAEARSIFVSSDGKMMFVGTGLQDDRDERLLIAIDRATGKILKTFKMSTPWRGVCMGGTCAVTVPVERTVYLLDEKRLEVKKKIKLNLQPLWFAVDAVSKKVFMSWMVGDDLAVLSLKNESMKEYSFESIRRHTYPFGIVEGIEYNRYNRNLYMVTESYFLRPCLYRYIFHLDNSNPQFSRTCFSYLDAFLSVGPSQGLAINLQKKEIYMATTFEGSVYLIQEEGFKRIRKVSVGVGVRELTFDSRREILYAANYITGELVGISPSSGRIIKRIFVGRRIRQINYEPRIDRLLAASANGFMEIRVDD